LEHLVRIDGQRPARRVVWELPIRVFVEPSADEVERCLARLGLLWQLGSDHRARDVGRGQSRIARAEFDQSSAAELRGGDAGRDGE
jgi:hypothetical protein